ncbi:antitoxin [Candidatus Poribacteria bacterium]|nr:MAG: antitoxin [Candidatus Poribacteria bacterium]
MVRIVANPGILGGKPIVEGTRLSVEHILGLLASGMSHEEIIADYPDLTEESIRAVLGYAARALKNDIVIDMPFPREGAS